MSAIVAWAIVAIHAATWIAWFWYFRPELWPKRLRRKL